MLNFSIKRIRLKRDSQKRKTVDMGDELARKGRWVALINQETGQGRRVRLYVKIKPLLGCLTGLLVTSYLASALALFVWLDRNPFNKVGYLDVAMPWRWSTLNMLRGEGFSEQGAVELENGEVARGLFYLRRGLSLKPDNEPTRLALAGYYARANYYPGVERTVRPQLKFGYSRPLLELLFPQAARADDADTILEVIDAMQPFVANDAEAQEWLVEWQVRTLIFSGANGRVLEVLAEKNYFESKWDLFKVDALIAEGDLDEALLVANAMPPAFPGMFPQALRAQARVLSARQDREALLAVLEKLFQDSRQVPEPWVLGIENLVRAEWYEDAGEFIDGFMRRFGAHPETVSSMVSRVLDAGNSKGSALVLQRISDWQEPSVAERAAFIWSLIREARWDKLAEAYGDGLGDESMDEFLQPLLRALNEATSESKSVEGLEAWLGRRGLNLNLYHYLIRGLSQDERWELVKMVAVAGRRYHPASTTLVNKLEEAEARLSAIQPDLRVGEAVAAVRTTYEDSDVMKLKYDLAQLVKEGDWGEVETLVLRVRRQRAAWLSKIEPELDIADAQAGAARDDWERLARLAPSVLRRDPERMGWFLDQADRAIAQGETRRALRLVEEILSVERVNYRAHQMWKKLTAPVEPIEESQPTEDAPRAGSPPA